MSKNVEIDPCIQSQEQTHPNQNRIADQKRGHEEPYHLHHELLRRLAGRGRRRRAASSCCRKTSPPKELAALQVSPVAAIFIALQLLRPSPQRVRSKAPTAFTATSNLPEPEKDSKKSKPGPRKWKGEEEMGRKGRERSGGRQRGVNVWWQVRVINMRIQKRRVFCTKAGRGPTGGGAHHGAEAAGYPPTSQIPLTCGPETA